MLFIYLPSKKVIINPVSSCSRFYFFNNSNYSSNNTFIDKMVVYPWYVLSFNSYKYIFNINKSLFYFSFLILRFWHLGFQQRWVKYVEVFCCYYYLFYVFFSLVALPFLPFLFCIPNLKFNPPTRNCIEKNTANDCTMIYSIFIIIFLDFVKEIFFCM